MKITCNIIKDILPMYEEGLVSDDTKVLVEEHLSECPECKNFHEKMVRTSTLMEEIKTGAMNQETENEVEKENRIVKRSFYKIKKRWIVSLVCIALLVPVVAFCGRVTANQIRGKGLRFTNMVDIQQCKSFFQKIKNQNFTGMYNMLNVEDELFFIQRMYEAEVNNETFMDTREVELDNGPWILAEHYEGDFEAYESEDAFWEDAINHPTWENVVLIPEKIWDAHVPSPLIKDFTWDEDKEKVSYYYPSKEWVDSNLKVVDGEEGDFWPTPGENVGFLYCKTKWGNFYAYGTSLVYELLYERETDEGVLDSIALLDGILDGDLDSRAKELALYAKVMPKKLYIDAEKEYQSQRKATIKEDEERYGDILDMTVEEYRDYKQKSYETIFQKYFQMGYSITRISYNDEDQDADDRNRINIRIEAQDSDRNKEKGTFELSVENGKINMLGCGIELPSGITEFESNPVPADSPLSLLNAICIGDDDTFNMAVE